MFSAAFIGGVPYQNRKILHFELFNNKISSSTFLNEYLTELYSWTSSIKNLLLHGVFPSYLWTHWQKIFSYSELKSVSLLLFSWRIEFLGMDSVSAAVTDKYCKNPCLMQLINSLAPQEPVFTSFCLLFPDMTSFSEVYLCVWGRPSGGEDMGFQRKYSLARPLNVTELSD